MNEIVNRIMEIWNKDISEDNTIFYSKSDSAFSEIDGYYPNSKWVEISRDKMKRIVKREVSKRLKLGKVYIYICRDNAIIAFEDYNTILQEDPEFINFCDEIANNLIEGWD